MTKCKNCGHNEHPLKAYFNKKDHKFIAKGKLKGESFAQTMLRFVETFELLKNRVACGMANEEQLAQYKQYRAILKRIDLPEELTSGLY